MKINKKKLRPPTLHYIEHMAKNFHFTVDVNFVCFSVIGLDAVSTFLLAASNWNTEYEYENPTSTVKLSWQALN